MKFYLKYINPIFSILVFVICIYSSIVDGNNVKYLALFDGGISGYFVAKGIFCALALFLLGKILQQLLFGQNANINGEDSK
ncbi:MAG: hypothetical protein JXA06_10180 [Bacteroidetes bacterium]|nr:hypothetical protein [Bacteroidota bacterium]